MRPPRLQKKKKVTQEKEEEQKKIIEGDGQNEFQNRAKIIGVEQSGISPGR